MLYPRLSISFTISFNTIVVVIQFWHISRKKSLEFTCLFNISLITSFIIPSISSFELTVRESI